MRTRFALPVFASVLCLAWVADAKLSRAGAPDVSFTAVGPAGMKIVGTTTELSVADDGQAVTVTVPLTNLTTGIALRDRHMKEKYLDVGKYPQAKLVVSRASIKFPSAGAESQSDGQGAMTIHGVTKNVPFKYTSKHDDRGYHVNGTVRLNIGDFGIEVPKYLGVTVKPDIDVAVRFDANDG